MKKITLLLIQLLTINVVTFAGEGAGRTGLSLIIGYDGAWLNYQENLPNGNFLDKDTGWLNGGFVEIRYDNRDFFIRADFNVIVSDNALYTGQLQNGTPISMYTKECIYTAYIDAGYKLFSIGTGTFSTYFEIGYRNWERGQDSGSNYKEIYYWWYGAAGINFDYKINNLIIGIDLALLIPFNPQMETNVAGLFDKAIFCLGT
jgi:hypothetical protein